MARLIYNKNRFTKVDKWDEITESYKGILMSTKLNQKNGQDYKLLDAIDIDWNRAWFMPNASYINTTEDLIEAIESLDNRAQVNEIEQQLDEVSETYVTQGQLRELTLGLQGNLHPGDHISIDDNNIISAYNIVSYETLYDFSLAYVSHEYFGSYAYTRQQTSDFVNQKINELVGNANEAFDTMQEISEWILQQTKFVPVDYDDIDTNGTTRYYVYDETTDKYSIVNNTYIAQHPTKQYYIIASFRDEFDRLDETIGHATWNDALQIYSYTGLLKEIDDLHDLDQRIIDSINTLKNQVTTASNYASMSYSTANIAYNTSNIAYELAYQSYFNGIDSYAMAYYAYVNVGFKSKPGYFRQMTDEEKETTPDGAIVYIYDDGLHYYREIEYVPNNNIEYYVYVQPTEATGLHKVAEDAITTANTALYHLNVDNTNSSYVRIYLDPSSYNGDVSRTIFVNTKEAKYSIETSIINIDGMEYNIEQCGISEDGILSAYQINEILAYAFNIEKITPV